MCDLVRLAKQKLILVQRLRTWPSGGEREQQRSVRGPRGPARPGVPRDSSFQVLGSAAGVCPAPNSRAGKFFFWVKAIKSVNALMSFESFVAPNQIEAFYVHA